MNVSPTITIDDASFPVRAVGFDRDKTLVHFDPAALGALEAEIAAIAPSLPPGATTSHWISWQGPWPRAAADEPQFWVAFWGALAEQYALGDARRERLIAVGARYHTCFRAFDDTQACLDILCRAGLRLAILTNFELPSVDRTLSQAGIDPRVFAVLLSSATLSAPKPEPAAFHALLAAVDLPASACVFVDDLPENAAGAAAIGMHAVLLDRDNRHSTWPGTRITTLAELPALLGLARSPGCADMVAD
jgi:putative hydrolase of the HAD superfamily